MQLPLSGPLEEAAVKRNDVDGGKGKPVAKWPHVRLRYLVIRSNYHKTGRKNPPKGPVLVPGRLPRHVRKFQTRQVVRLLALVGWNNNVNVSN